MAKIKFTDLKPGMLTDQGLIIATGMPGTSKFYGNEAYMRFLQIEDAYYGTCTRTVQVDDEFEIVYPEGSAEYLAAVKKIVSDVVERMSDLETLLDLLQAYRRIR